MSSRLFEEALNPQSILLTDVSGYSVGPVFVDKVLRSAVPTEDRSKILILETELRANQLNWIPVLYAHNKDEDYLCAVRSLWRDVKAWNEDGSAVSDSQHLEKLLKDVENYAADDSKTIVYVNLTSLLFSFSVAKISRLLVAVTNTFNVRLSVFQIHADCHPPATVDGLKKLVDASLEISKPNYDGQNGAKVHLTSYKTKGRNSYVHKYYRVDSNFHFLPLTSESYWRQEPTEEKQCDQTQRKVSEEKQNERDANLLGREKLLIFDGKTRFVDKSPKKLRIYNMISPTTPTDSPRWSQLDYGLFLNEI